jgi:hypothetical protein
VWVDLAANYHQPNEFSKAMDKPTNQPTSKSIQSLFPRAQAFIKQGGGISDNNIQANNPNNPTGDDEAVPCHTEEAPRQPLGLTRPVTVPPRRRNRAKTGQGIET